MQSYRFYAVYMHIRTGNFIKDKESISCQARICESVSESSGKAFHHAPFLFKASILKILLRNSLKPVLFGGFPGTRNTKCTRVREMLRCATGRAELLWRVFPKRERERRRDRRAKARGGRPNQNFVSGTILSSSEPLTTWFFVKT